MALMTQKRGKVGHAMLRVTKEMRKNGGTSIYTRSAKGLEKFVRYIKGSLYRISPFNEFIYIHI